MSEWISVRDRLPEIGVNVLVYDKEGVHGGNQIDIEYLLDDGFWSGDGLFTRISHWMPLPEVPK